MPNLAVNVELQDPDSQTRACEKLLSAVVVCALRDLAAPGSSRTYRKSTEPGKSRALQAAGISPHAFTAARFLFGSEQTGVEAYLEWLDIDPDMWRKKLLDAIYSPSPHKVGGWEPEARRNMRVNIKVWKKLSYLTEEEIHDDD